MHTLRFASLLLAWITVSLGARAETFEVLGKRLQLSPPPGFCEVGQSPREQVLREFQQQNTRSVGVLAHLVVPCDELRAYKAGTADSFTRWAQVLVGKREGRLSLVTVSREVFIRNTAGNANKPLDLAEVDRKIREGLADKSVAVNVSGMRPLGTTQQAFFAELRMSLKTDGETTPIVAILAATVAQQLPLIVQVYATPQATGAPLMETTTAYVDAVLSKN